MGNTYSEITPELAAWIAHQKMFFVATAPLSAAGHINCSPKGLDSLRILDSRTVAYVDLTGSGAETAAHITENGRIVLMFCSFEGPPKIARLHGHAEVIVPSMPAWQQLAAQLPMQPGARAIILVHVRRVSDSCGYAVPKMQFVEERDVLQRWVQRKGLAALPQYRREKNASSIDGLPTAPFDAD